MLRYDLDRLGWFEFEQLIQTLLKIRLGPGIEAWGGRGDWGRDAYYDGMLPYPTRRKTRGTFVFQCKFVEAANAAGAKPQALILGAVRKEREFIRKRQQALVWKAQPTVYALFTNCPVDPANREKIAEEILSVIPDAHVGIHDGHDVCQWLNTSPEVVRSFPQLLSLRDLQEWLRECVHSDVLSRSETAIGLAQAQAKVFVPTRAYFDARSKLQKHHFVVLEGPPEMGKTTIGRIIALSQVASEWEAIECREPADVLRMYRKARAQVFVADDFFGRTEYHPERVSKWQDDLPLILPRLNANHWLILTSRAHLLEMGKARLDVAGENNRFPRLGEVIVNAGRLSQMEKARMLYRHAKAVALDPSSKQIIRGSALMIVNDPHFTPERIRRLVVETIPHLAGDGSAPEASRLAIGEALANPTREMRVSFRALPASHRWLLFALLESDEALRSPDELRERFEELCPSDDQEPYVRVLSELTEAFVKRSQDVFKGEQIDWIHPSCRDLAIDELADNPAARERFLANCSRAGIELATSLAGGADGQRQLPLLQTQRDWETLATRAADLVRAGVPLLSVLWQNLQTTLAVDGDEPRLNSARDRLKSVIAKAVLPTAAEKLQMASYDEEYEEFQAFFEARASIGAKVLVDPTHQWDEIELDVRDWTSSTDDFWDAQDTPGKVVRFIRLLQLHEAEFMKSERIQESLAELLEKIRLRGDADAAQSEEGLNYEDEYAGRASACSEMARTFSQFGLLEEAGPLQAEFRRIGQEFEQAAEALQEQIPSESEDDDRDYSPSTDREVSVGELFRDL